MKARNRQQQHAPRNDANARDLTSRTSEETRMLFKRWLFAATVLATLLAASARAEMAEIKVAQQYGIGYLPLMVMEEQKLIEKDKIALPAVKVSIQAVTLQMAAEKVFGEGQQNRLDSLTVSMSHPDAQVALLSGASEVTAHFSSPPFQYQQLKKPGIHTVLN